MTYRQKMTERQKKMVLTRKQQEIVERKAFILEHAEQMLVESGFSSITMEKLAQQTGLAKGTLYQYFSCKEDVVGELCAQSFELCLSLFRASESFAGCSRERVVAMMECYTRYVEDKPSLHDAAKLIKSPDIVSKLSPEIRHKLDACDQVPYAIVRNIAQQATEAGELLLPAGISIEDVIFGARSMIFGTYALLDLPACYLYLGDHDPIDVTRRNLQCLLDGYGWQPLSSEWDYKKTIQRVHNEILQSMVSS